MKYKEGDKFICITDYIPVNETEIHFLKGEEYTLIEYNSGWENYVFKTRVGFYYCAFDEKDISSYFISIN